MRKTQILINTCLEYTGLLLGVFLLFCLHPASYAQENHADSQNKIRTIVIDPGHGGKDSGARGKISYEKDIVLAIGLQLGKYISEYLPEVHVIYTRTTDEFIPLYRRAEIANEAKADLFISIHANGWSDPKSKGTETLVLGLHRSDENFEVAKRENAVILMEEDHEARYENFDPNSLESYIIFSLMQNVYDHQSISFADNVQDQFRERTHRQDRGVKRQGLLVLAQTSMPGVLIETGFITNPEEEKYMSSREGQEFLASAIFRAFRDYKTDIEEKSQAPQLTANDTPTTKPAPSALPKMVKPIPDSGIAPLYFKVQIVSSEVSIDLNSELFSAFSDIEEFKVDQTYKYAVGYKYSYNEILEYSKWVKSRLPDAFIIAVKNNAIIPIPEALKELKTN